MTSPNILISSAGRRVGLYACIQDSIARRGVGAQVFTIDAGSSAPACFVAGKSFRVPHCKDSGFIDAVLEVCVENRVGLVIPTIDPELPAYARAAGMFAAIGVTVGVSSSAATEICADKVATHRWLLKNGFPTVRQTDIRSAVSQASAWPLPLIAKPRNGSASSGVRRIRSQLELEANAAMNLDDVVEEIAPGREFTINVYVNRLGRCVCAVPHWRMEVRAGEVSKGLTVKDRGLIDLSQAIAEALPGAYGPLNIQCFMDDGGAIRIIEMNARFGGGYPLAHRAGARFTDWLLDEREGRSPDYFDDWTDDLAMLRYDEAVFVSGAGIRQ